MNKSMLIGVVAGAVIVTAGGAFAGYKSWENDHYAEVLSADLVTKSVKTPRQECHDETVTHQQQPKDEHRVAGTVIGAVVGGVLGNQVGGGNGKKVATVAGAAAGGYAGNQVQERMQKGNTYTTTEQRCTTAYDTEQRPAGYDVKVSMDGRTQTVRMDHDPGRRIPIENGQLVLN
ncbi:MAG: glycine zipper 2TM domain-containing protein [Steroidobacteraceae bacterium]